MTTITDMDKAELDRIFAADERIAIVRYYPAGFVPNSYKWRCRRVAVEYLRDGSRRTHTYDAKRSWGRGPTWVALSEKMGRLASS